MSWRKKLSKISEDIEKDTYHLKFIFLGLIPTAYYALQGYLWALLMFIFVGLIIITLIIVSSRQRYYHRKLQREWRLQNVRAMLLKEQKAWRKVPKPLWED